MKPKFCPNCGKELNDESFHLTSFTKLIFNDGKEDELIVPINGWRVDCFHCNWEGEILPSEDA